MATRRKKELEASDVCSILEACVKARVAVLRYRGLEIKFRGRLKKRLEEKEVPSNIVAESYAASPESTSAEIRELALDLKKQQLDQMLIEDPSQYESLLASGEIEDEEQNEDYGA